MVSCQGNGTQAETEELTEEMLDMKYVEENVLTNTDRFLEEQITGSFRTWHVMFTAVENEKHVILIASTVLTVTVVTVSCFVRVRVPRTKSEIEANSKRKELLKNFKIKLKNLKAAELDELDYRKALEKLREEFKADNESLAQSEAISIMSLCDDPLTEDEENADGANEATAAKKNGKENV